MGYVMQRKRQHKPEELPSNKHARFMFNLKRYYLSHQEVVEAFEKDNIGQELIEKFKNDYISVIAAYANAAHSYELDHAWAYPDEKEMKKEIEGCMKEFRKSVVVLKQINEVTDEKRNRDTDTGRSKRKYTKRK